tara:strand:+ start:192 stop:1649 length:1458 start_codon:yes stop_codon:yes gene_type:complete
MNDPQTKKWLNSPYLKKIHNIAKEFYNNNAEYRNQYIEKNEYYYGKIIEILNFILEDDKRILHVGCQTGHILSRLNGAEKVGLDLSSKLIDIAKRDHSEISFDVQENFSVDRDEDFDYVIISNTGDLVNPITTFDSLRDGPGKNALMIIHTYNHLWRPILGIGQLLKLKFPQPEQNWLSLRELRNILALSDYEVIKVYRQLIFPKRVPILSWFFNEILAKLPGFRHLCMTLVLVVRPVPQAPVERNHSVSVIVPCKNEVDNVRDAVERIPELGQHTEIIFCDDKSTDGTADEVRRCQADFPNKDIKLLDGPGICKSLNVWTGFHAAEGDILIILDADLTTMPEELPYFYQTLVSGKADFVNGTRLVFPIEDEAMRYLNMIGNKVFSYIFTFILDQRITDTLCGTKVLWRKDWPMIYSMVGTWGIEDRWGDFDLLFGAAKLHLKIAEVPVHYVERVSGTTKMNRVILNGFRMLRICISAYWRFKRV